MVDESRNVDPGDSDDYPGAPFWAKVMGIIIAIPVLLFVVLMIVRGHGPGGH